MIAHFSSALVGGAHIAGIRLHEQFRKQGLESCFYYGSGNTPDPSYFPFFQNKSFFWRNAAALSVSWRTRRAAPEGFVFGPRWVRKTPIDGIGKTPIVINLHWVERWLDLPSFFGSIPRETPIIWTLHNLTPITGGCHYPQECLRFTSVCDDCPQHRWPSPTKKFQHLKRRLFENANVHFVGNSEWTTAQAQRSSLFRYVKSIRTIHLGLDPEQYRPVPKALAREALGIPPGKFIIGFSCVDLSEKRKGAHILMEALRSLPCDEFVLLILGAGHWPPGGFKIIPLGSLGSPRLQSLFYSSLDVFAMPSLVETFGNVAMEAMACETPVLAYPAGGVADVVAHGETGLIEPEIGSTSGFARMLQWMLKHPKERAEMGLAARKRVLTNFTDSLMSSRYMDLYHELLPHEANFQPIRSGMLPSCE